MTAADWTSLLWKLIIAVAPIIVSVVVKLVTDAIGTMTEANREKLEYWVGVFVKTAQMLEPDPQKRKAWVMAQVTKLYPEIDQTQLSALIEAVLAQIKLDNGDLWEDLTPDATPATPAS